MTIIEIVLLNLAKSIYNRLEEGLEQKAAKIAGRRRGNARSAGNVKCAVS
jgi:hypothetical protein